MKRVNRIGSGGGRQLVILLIVVVCILNFTVQTVTATITTPASQNQQHFKSLFSKLSSSLQTARNHDNTDDSLFKKIVDYHQEQQKNHKDARSLSLSSTNNNSPQQHQPFLIELNRDGNVCKSAAACHSEMMSRLGVDRHSYEIISKDIALVTTSWDKLDTHSTAAADGTASISSYVAFHPSLKLSKAVVGMKQYKGGKESCFKSDNPSVSSVGTAFKLLVVLSPPQSEEAYEQFLSFLDSMMSDVKYNDEIIEEIITDLDERAGYHGSQRFASTDDATSSNNNNKRRLSSKTRSRALRVEETQQDGSKATTKKVLLQVLIKDCSKVYEIAEQFSLRPEVLYIDHLTEIHTLNAFAKNTVDSGIIHENTVLKHFPTMTEDSLIGIVDTGLDLEQCYFFDQQSPVVNYTTNLNNLQFNTKHRKLNTYIAFADKEENAGHGTRVAGTAVGKFANYDGIVPTSQAYYEPFNGMNPQSKINLYDIQYTDYSTSTESGTPTYRYNLPLNLNEDVFLILKKAGSAIITNSWGNSGYSYDSYCSQSDEFMYNNPDALVIFAAGNYGGNGVGTVISAALAKNVLAVGASLSDQASWKYFGMTYAINNTRYDKDTVATFSSMGPTMDGRLKPDILAPGDYIYSAVGRGGTTSPYCGLDLMSGTSMAAPVIAGIANYIRQYFIQGYYNPTWSIGTDASTTTTVANIQGFIPSGALLKAMIIHSGQAMRYRSNYELLTYPSVEQGYGRAQIASVLKFNAVTSPTPMPASGPENLFVIGSAWYPSNNMEQQQKGLYQSIVTNTSHSLWLKIPDTTRIPSSTGGNGKLSWRITLAYTDAPVSPLVNDLMSSHLLLSVTESPDTCHNATGTIFDCTHFPNIGGGATILSNVQMINIENALPGKTYEIKIHNAIESLQGSQAYALVITGPFEMLTNVPQVTIGDTLSINKASKYIYYNQGNEASALGDAFVYTVPPTAAPSLVPTEQPTHQPTVKPTALPTAQPTRSPTLVQETAKPTVSGGIDSNGNSNGKSFEQTTPFAIIIGVSIVFFIILIGIIAYYVLVIRKKQAERAYHGGLLYGDDGSVEFDGDLEFDEVILER